MNLYERFMHYVLWVEPPDTGLQRWDRVVLGCLMVGVACLLVMVAVFASLAILALIGALT